MINKHQISLYLGLKKMGNILQMTFSNGFSFKKIINMKFSGVITNDRSDVYAKVKGQSKVKVTEVKTQISRFGTITPGWFHIW